jgi:hypothetical protein
MMPMMVIVVMMMVVMTKKRLWWGYKKTRTANAHETFKLKKTRRITATSVPKSPV